MKAIAFAVRVIANFIMREEWISLQNRVDDALRAVSAIPGRLEQELLICGEDHRFFRHAGIDLISVVRALWRCWIQHRIEGASTIEMQVVRVLTGRYERTWRRKLREMALATLLSEYVGKSPLPSLYLYIGYYGWRMNGLSQARRRLGIKNWSHLDHARLVARLKYPEPRMMTSNRAHQIERRAEHLLSLHARYSAAGAFKALKIQVYGAV